MALEFIPNQPILFEDPLFAGQTCLNNDVRAYAQLAQAGDTTCIQWNNPPLYELANCNMLSQPDVVSGGTFDNTLTGWLEYDKSTGTILGPPTYWTYTGAGASPNSSFPDIALYQALPVPAGNVVLISWTQDDAAGDVYIGVGNAVTNSWNIFNYSAYPGLNIDGRRCIVLTAYTGGADLLIYGSASSTWSINDVVVRDVTNAQCFTPNNPSFQNWTYVESVNGYQKLDNLYGNPLTLNVFIQTGTTYKINFSVQNMPVALTNSIGIYDATTNLPILVGTENKTYTTYYTHTAASTYIDIEIANAFGTDMKDSIIYDISVGEMNYDYRARIVNLDSSCASINYDSSDVVNFITFFEDKMIWCFQWDTLINCTNPFVGLDSGCYKVLIEDLQLNISYESYTTVNYTTGTHECSAMVVGDNESNAFGFFFNNPSTSVSFTLRQRLRLLQFNPVYPIKTEEYTFSTGINKRTFAQSAKVRTAWFDYVDEPTHDVIRLQLISDTLTIDNKEYFFIADNYEPEWGQNGKYNLAQSKVELTAVNEPILYNKNC